MSGPAPDVVDGARDPAGAADTSAARLIGTLATGGAVAGLAIVLVFLWADPRIRAHRAETLHAAVQEVLAGPDRYETLFVVDGGLTARPPAGVDSAGLDRVYRGYDADGRPTGYAITAEKPGFQDVIRLIFGYDVRTGRVLGMRVLESRETPGLGSKIITDSAFVAGFDGPRAPLTGVKPGAGTGADDEVDMITGATISSRTVIDAINERLERLGPMLEAGRTDAGGGP